MNQPYIKPVFVGYLVLMTVIGVFSKNFEVKAEEPIAERTFEVIEKVYQLEMNHANFDEIKKDVIKKDIKYIANPETLNTDVELSEVVAAELDYLSFDEQKINIEVVRYSESKAGKVVYDKIESEVTVKFIDTIAPEITLSESSVEFDQGEEFDPYDYVESVTDNSFDEINLDIDNPVDVDEPGEYTVVYTATDKSNNVSTAELTVIVNEVEEEEEEVEEEAVVEQDLPNRNSAPETPDVPFTGTVSGSAIANAALAQVGVYQDCTMLVTNALRAVGIYHHSSPAGYMGLGRIVSASEAQPGDIVYYANGGMGMAHVAIYIGGGQAVHGGWTGNQTVVTTVYVGSGPVFIRL